MFARRSVLLVSLTLTTLTQGAFPATNPPASSQSAESKSAPERLTADAARMSPGGTTFKAPSGWSIVTGKNLVILEPPENDTHIAIIDVQAADAAAAVAAGWAVYKPDNKRPLKIATPRPARNGWD